MGQVRDEEAPPVSPLREADMSADAISRAVHQALMDGMPAAEAPALAERLRANGHDELNPPPENSNSSADDESNAWTAIDLEVLAEREPEAPSFIIDPWLPVGYATLLAGHGGVGKSTIALYLAVCLASGKPFFGTPVQRKRALYLSCEDRQNVLHWRLARVCAHLGVDFMSLRGWLQLVDLVGQDSVLWDRDPRTGFTITPALGRLEATIRRYAAEVIFVDGVSDTFGGREADRGDVKRYVNGLLGLVPADQGALVLIGHVAKPTAANGSTSEGYSGSTQWHNAVRARWYLRPETEESDDADRPQRTGRLLLELQKSNLGRTDQSITFAWDQAAHLFVGQPTAASAFDRKHLEREELRAISRSLASASALVVPAAATGPRTAYHVLSARPEFPQSLRSGKAGIRRFWRHIENLRAMGHVEEATMRRADRHFVRHLVLTQEGMRACEQ